MAKLIIMQGLPASGKSTRAQEIIEKSGNTVRVNRDLLRKMLHFDKWTGYNESITIAMAQAIAKECLIAGVNVIIDDTNLNKGTLASWIDMAKRMEQKYEIEEMNTPWDVCVERDQKRENSVGRSVIVGMALKVGLYPKPEKGVILCDLDGTLADIDHRLHFVKVKEGEQKDWKGFFAEIKNDTPRQNVVDMVMKHEGEGRKIFLVSARPEECRAETEAWLEKTFKGYRFYEALFMRPQNDKREDSEVKAKMLADLFPDISWIEEVIDDRPRVIRMWREKGLKVVDVGPGIEF